MLKFIILLSFSLYAQTISYTPNVHYARKHQTNNLGSGLSFIVDSEKYQASFNWNLFTPIGVMTENAAKYATNLQLDILYNLDRSHNFYIGPGVHYNERVRPAIVGLLQFPALYGVPLQIKANLTQEQFLMSFGFRFNFGW